MPNSQPALSYPLSVLPMDMTDHKIKVLLVDDEPDILEFLHYNLSRNGFDTIQASNGLDAIKLANDEIPDLILLDIMMPGMDGVETCRNLRKPPAKPARKQTCNPLSFRQDKGFDNLHLIMRMTC